MGDVQRYERAKLAYEKYRLTNTSLIMKIFSKSPNETRGNGHWYSYYEDAPAFADYLMMHGQAVAFYNCWSIDIIATELQKVCNSGSRPECVILCYSNGRPSEDIVIGVRDNCERISTGTVQVPKFRMGDVPLNTWRPHVFVFADFHPAIERGFDNGHWALAVPERMNRTGHLFVPKDCVESLIETARNLISPNPGIIGVEVLLDSLRAMVRDLKVPPEDLSGAFKTIGEAARALLNILTPTVMAEYWRRGFQPVITVCNTIACPLSEDRLEEPDFGETLPFTATTTTESLIGKTGKLGNVYIRSLKLTDADKEVAAEKIRRMTLPSIDQIEGIVREGAYPAIQAPEQTPSLLRDGAPSRALGGPFGGERASFEEFGPVNEVAVFNEVATFLRVTNGIVTPTPLGDFRTNGWVLEDKRVIVEVDMSVPVKGEVYKTLYWFEQGYRTIRLRADEIGPEWKIEFGSGFTVELEQAIMGGSGKQFWFLERTPSRSSWKELQAELAAYYPHLMSHVEWWKVKIGPHDPQFEEDVPTPPSAEDPDTSQDVPIEVPQPPKPATAWAIYCRTTAGSDDLIGQRNYCLAHANEKGLIPVAGPRNYFEDICPAETPPGSRPGLQALLKSGATGLLCAHVSLLADGPSQGAAVEFLGALGVAFLAASP
jgi:hypothetical protein